MNESKSSRYHRLKRRADILALGCSIAVLLAFLWGRPTLPLWVYVLALAGATEAVTLPIAFYAGLTLERRYELSTLSTRAWLKDHVKAVGFSALIAVTAAQFVYLLIRWNSTWWWLPAAAGITGFVALLARLAPVVLMPMFYRFAPLDRRDLTARLLTLCERAGVPVLGVYEWGLGAKTRRANAALTGTGGTRRILLSDTLLAEYTDDEIEVILAHELAHHVHHDISKRLLLELVIVSAACLAASAALSLAWQPLALSGPADVRGLPVVLLAAGAVALAFTPFVNYISRANERRADRFALALTGQHEAFVSAMRRLGAQNLSEEHPSRPTVWLFHTHPPIEERIALAREAG